uniref:UEV domain-containing protein n=1 Tax=Myotis myotis TaxID=51298 RepID=A0A7J7ZYS1_MYOMY|nr:hypothetical protein mMyoMyo1_009760 [Myotis myotis]
MAVSESQLKKMVSKYKYRDLTVRETINVITLYKDLKPVLDSYVFNDGSSRELMNLTGTVPVLYRGNTYNIPICLWLLDTYPYNPPICFVKPTSSMTIKTGKHVDANGKIYLPYLHEWKHPQSDLLGLIQVMIVVFGGEPPVFSRPTIPGNRATKYFLHARHAQWNLFIPIWIPFQSQWLPRLSLPTWWSVSCHNKFPVPFSASHEHCWSQ